MERSAWPKNLSSNRKREIQELCGQNPKKLRDAFDAYSQTGDDPRQPLFAGDLIFSVLGSFSSNTQSLSSGFESYEVSQVPGNAFVSSEISEGSESINTPVQRLQRSCTKVHKQGNLVGRGIDLSRLNSYQDLLNDLERLFSMEGLLRDPDKGWRILYTDSENDVMVLGDIPWHEFGDVVTKIHIYTQEEVEKMITG